MINASVPGQDIGHIQFYDIENELRLISQTNPVFAFLNSSRMLLTREPAEFAYKPPPAEMTDLNRLALIYASQFGQSVRSYNSTNNFT